MNMCLRYIFLLIVLLEVSTTPLLGSSHDILLNSFPADLQDDYVYKRRSEDYLQKYTAIKRKNFPESSSQRLFTLCIEGPIYLFLAGRYDALKSWMSDLRSEKMPSYLRNSAHNLYLVQALHLWMGNDEDVRALQDQIQTISKEHKSRTLGFLGYLRETDDRVIKPFLERKRQEKEAEEIVQQTEVISSQRQKKQPRKKETLPLQTDVDVKSQTMTPSSTPLKDHLQLHNATRESIQKLLEEGKTCENYFEAAILNRSTEYNSVTRKETKGYLRSAIVMGASLPLEERTVLLSRMQEKAGDEIKGLFDEEFVAKFMTDPSSKEVTSPEQKILIEAEEPLKLQLELELESIQLALVDPTTRTCEDLLKASVLYAYHPGDTKKQKKIQKFLTEAIAKGSSLTREEREALLVKIQTFASDHDIICPFFDEKFRQDFIIQDHKAEPMPLDSISTEVDTHEVVEEKNNDTEILNLLFNLPKQVKSRRQLKNNAYWRGVRDAEFGKEIAIHHAFQQGYFYQQNKIATSVVIDTSIPGFTRVIINGQFHPLVNMNGQNGVLIGGLFYPIYF